MHAYFHQNCCQLPMLQEKICDSRTKWLIILVPLHALFYQFQITLKDYHFSTKFKENCKADVLEHCPDIKKK